MEEDDRPVEIACIGFQDRHCTRVLSKWGRQGWAGLLLGSPQRDGSPILLGLSMVTQWGYFLIFCIKAPDWLASAMLRREAGHTLAILQKKKPAKVQRMSVSCPRSHSRNLNLSSVYSLVFLIPPHVFSSHREGFTENSPE